MPNTGSVLHSMQQQCYSRARPADTYSGPSIMGVLRLKAICTSGCSSLNSCAALQWLPARQAPRVIMCTHSRVHLPARMWGSGSTHRTFCFSSASCRGGGWGVRGQQAVRAPSSHQRTTMQCDSQLPAATTSPGLPTWMASLMSVWNIHSGWWKCSSATPQMLPSPTGCPSGISAKGTSTGRSPLLRSSTVREVRRSTKPSCTAVVGSQPWHST
jgi:hypothetical protein